MLNRNLPFVLVLGLVGLTGIYASAAPATVENPAVAVQEEQRANQQGIVVEAPVARPQADATTSAKPQLASIPAVEYSKTGDPVTDVLILLDLFEKGKITRDQFEREKDLALQQVD